MKKIVALFLLCLFTGQGKVFSFQKGIQYGASLGLAGNNSYFIGGSDQAHGSFHRNVFGTASLNFSARYFLNETWSVQSGIGFTELGFESGFTQNYSLIKNNHFVLNRQSLPVTQIPLMGIYSFKPDCKNRNWFIGAGFNFMFVGKKNNEIKQPAMAGDELNLLPEVLNYTSELRVTKKSTPSIQFMAGREKKFSKGNRLSVAFLYNIGLTGTMATSSVAYTIDGTDYNHIFSNRGDFAGLCFTYYFSSKATRNSSRSMELLDK